MGCKLSCLASPNNFSNTYELGPQLGKGNSAVVKKCISKESGQSYAVKICTKARMNSQERRDLEKEVTILRSMNHKFIIEFHGIFEDKQSYYLVTELMQGGQLMDRIINKSSYTEKDARELCQRILEAVNFCHNNKVVHRDIKPENILLNSKIDDSDIKVADFGFATFFTPGEDSLATACGTPHFVAPEILLQKKYGASVDLWSLGVVTYLLLRGEVPFDAKELRDLYRQICRKKVVFDKYWDHISPEAKSFISSLLNVNPKERLTASKALEHPWLSPNHVTSDHQLSDTLEQLRKYNLKRKLRAAVFTVIVTNRLTSLGLSYERRTITEDTAESNMHD